MLKKALKDKKTIVLKTHNKTKQRKTKGNNLIEKHWNLYRIFKRREEKKKNKKQPTNMVLLSSHLWKYIKKQTTGKVNVLQELNGKKRKKRSYWQRILATLVPSGFLPSPKSPFAGSLLEQTVWTSAAHNDRGVDLGVSLSLGKGGKNYEEK